MFVNIIIMGQPQQRVEVSGEATVLNAIQLAGIPAERISEVKSNGATLKLSSPVTDGMSLLVVTGKITGGSDEQSTDSEVVFITATVEERDESEIAADAPVAFRRGDMMELAQQMHVNMNYYSHVEDENGNRLPQDQLIEDGGKYVVVVKA